MTVYTDFYKNFKDFLQNKYDNAIIRDITRHIQGVLSQKKTGTQKRIPVRFY